MCGSHHRIIGIAASTLAASIVYKSTNDPSAVLLIPFGAFGSMLPDIDHNNSKMGAARKKLVGITRMVIIIAYFSFVVLTIVKAVMDKNYSRLKSTLVLQAIFFVGLFILFAIINIPSIRKKVTFFTKHRGVMHTLLLVGIMFYLSTTIPSLLGRAFLVGCFGYASHLLADTLTTAGCPILWPLSSKNISLGLAKTERGQLVWTIILSLIFGGIAVWVLM